MILTGLSYQKKSLEVRGREETYVEGHISHRIEDLKQRRGWVAVVVRLTDLINFVSAIIPVIKSANSVKQQSKLTIMEQGPYDQSCAAPAQISQVRWQRKSDDDPESPPHHARHRERCVGTASQERERLTDYERSFPCSGVR